MNKCTWSHVFIPLYKYQNSKGVLTVAVLIKQIIYTGLSHHLPVSKS